MQMSPLGKKPNNQYLRRAAFSGFTLLEVLVVVAIIGVLTGVAVSMMKFDRYEQTLRDKVYAFQQFYQAVQDEALLTGKPLRLRLEDSRLRLEKRQGSQWQSLAIHGKQDFAFEAPFNIVLSPQAPLLFLPTGQSQSFQLQVTIDAYQQRVDGDAMGNLTVVTP